MPVSDPVLQLQIMISAVIFGSNVWCLTVLTSEIYPTDYDAKVENTWKITAIHSQRQTLLHTPNSRYPQITDFCIAIIAILK